MDEVVGLWVESWNATMPEIDFSARGGWLRERLAAHQAAGVAVVCAVDATDGPLGFVTVDPDGGHIDQLAVRWRCFGTGVGTALIASARNVSPISLKLEVNQENPRAVRFYGREGFVITGAGTVGMTRRPTWLMQWRNARHAPPSSALTEV